MGYKLEDFVSIKKNHSGMDPDSLISICKRYNNSKRSFLFVNRYQAKHIPTRFKDFEKLTDSLYEEINPAFSKDSNILVIGFAETATGLSAAIMDKLSDVYENIWYVQTTRRKLPLKSLDFKEEHSHATEQYLYWDCDTPIDHIIMIDDEITTGKTVRNMVSCLKQYYPNASYCCVSILNWQTQENTKKFNSYGIQAVSLISGALKSDIPSMNDITHEGYLPIVIPDEKNTSRKKTVKKNSIFLTGCSKKQFLQYKLNLVSTFTKFFSHNEELAKKKFLILGTEECMIPAIWLSSLIENSVSQSTTRSPITVSSTDGYLIQEGYSMTSNYGDYDVHLYNIPENEYDAVILITDQNAERFAKQIDSLRNTKHIPVFLFSETKQNMQHRKIINAISETKQNTQHRRIINAI